MNKAKFRHELRAALSIAAPGFHIVAEMTTRGYHGTIPSADGKGVIIDYDQLVILGSDIDNHLFVFIGDFSTSTVFEVRVEAPDMLAFRYAIQDAPTLIFSKNPNLKSKLQQHQQGAEIEMIMDAIYSAFIKS